MEPIGILYATPTWVTFVVTAVIGLVAMEGGLRLGRRRGDPEPEQGPVDTLAAGTVGLLAFLLAFAFGIAAARFDTRSDLVVAEAQATRGTFLYASLLPSPQRERSQEMVREYVAIRIEGIKHAGKRRAAIQRSQLGLARSRRPVVALFGVLALAVVVTMIMDLDRGQQGFLTVSQSALADVLSSMSTEAP